MNYCPNCGGELTAGLKYCPNCGTLLQENAFESAPLPEKEIFPESGKRPSSDNVFENLNSGKNTDFSDSKDYSGSAAAGAAAGFAAGAASQERESYRTGTRSSYEGTSAYRESSYETGPAEGSSTNGFAIASLVCGIISLFLDVLLAIPGILAIIFGIVGLRNAEETGSGRGMSIAGIVLGIIGIAGWIILIILAVVFAGVMVSI